MKNNFKFIHFGDTHLGIDLKQHSKKPQKWHRSQDFQFNFDRVISFANRSDIDFVLHSGDLFDRSKPPQNILKKTYESLDSSSKLNDLEEIINYFNRLKLSIEE